MTAHTFQEWDVRDTHLIGPGSVEERGSGRIPMFLVLSWGGNIEGKDLDLTEPTPVPRSLTTSQLAPVVKNLPSNAEDVRDAGSIPGSGRSRKTPGGGNGNPLQYSCLKNPMDRGAWRAAVYGIAKSQTRLGN